MLFHYHLIYEILRIYKCNDENTDVQHLISIDNINFSLYIIGA